MSYQNWNTQMQTKNPTADSMSGFAYAIQKLTFSDATVVDLPTCGVVVLAGPNNAGKSQALHDIAAHIGAIDRTKAIAVTGIHELRIGSAEDFFNWVCDRSVLRIEKAGQGESLTTLGYSVSTDSIQKFCAEKWRMRPGMDILGRSIAALLDTRTRLSSSDPVASYDAVAGRPSNPIQVLFEDSSTERRISAKFRAVFGTELRVNRLGGSHIQLHVGPAPDPEQYGGELTVAYQKAVRELPLLHQQGDGMRSFVACLLNSEAISYPVLLVDEPESFLHPAQARALAQDLAATTRRTHGQVFVATHSSDVIRGLLSSGHVEITVIRLKRDGDRNIPCQISSSDVKSLWTDPLLRASNLLDGLFHECLCLCEADTDVRFYSALLDAMCESRVRRRPDVMFTHCNGKHRMGSVVRSLRAVDVPVKVIADIDLLDSEAPLRGIWEGLGRMWQEIASDWRLVERAVAQTRSAPSVATFRERVESILSELQEGKLTEESIKRLRAATSLDGGWRTVKQGGERSLPKGDARSAYERLKQALCQAGVFLVPVGELEGFLPTVGGKGPQWVNEAVQCDMASAPELSEARSFMESIFPHLKE
ncbi:ATP-dependent nuclease [Sorangium sp. So ce854]|uniref:ATP-dependent nuclease n=1 Tax=Sorangium sp. So ce854 TaxID=3133322 RepID=UPI003F60D943